MTLNQILLDCYRRTGYKAVPDGEVTTRFSQWANETQDEIIREPGCESLVRIQGTLDSVADQAEYALGMAYARISGVRDISHRITLRPMSEYEYRSKVTDPSETGGQAWFYVPLASAPVALRPSDASELFIKSDSSLDVQTVEWEVLLESGEVRIGTVTLTGGVAVSLDTTLTTIVQVLNLYLSQAANGTVTLHEDSGAGTELARITIGKVKTARLQLALYPTPSEAITYTVEGERDNTALIETSDEPILPMRFHPMIGIGIRKREYELRGNTDRWAMAQREWEEWRGQLRAFLDPTHGIIVPGGHASGWSQLGPTYPAEWWR